jgi:hypothetical protein
MEPTVSSLPCGPAALSFRVETTIHADRKHQGVSSMQSRSFSSGGGWAKARILCPISLDINSVLADTPSSG